MTQKKLFLKTDKKLNEDIKTKKIKIQNEIEKETKC